MRARAGALAGPRAWTGALAGPRAWAGALAGARTRKANCFCSIKSLLHQEHQAKRALDDDVVSV